MSLREPMTTWWCVAAIRWITLQETRRSALLCSYSMMCPPRLAAGSMVSIRDISTGAVTVAEFPLKWKKGGN